MTDEATKYSATCERFPNLQIGSDIAFKDGVFTTTNAAVWAQLQQHEWWDVLIKSAGVSAGTEAQQPASTPPSEEVSGGTRPPGAPDDDESGGNVRRGSRGTR